MRGRDEDSKDIRMKLYGWNEQNECAYFLDRIDVETSDIANDAFECKEERFVLNRRRGEGRWFTTFSAAKKEALAMWRYQIKIARSAIRDISKTKKADL